MSSSQNSSPKLNSDNCESWHEFSGTPELRPKTHKTWAIGLGLLPNHTRGSSTPSIASSVVSSPQEERLEAELLDTENCAWI